MFASSLALFSCSYAGMVAIIVGATTIIHVTHVVANILIDVTEWSLISALKFLPIIGTCTCILLIVYDTSSSTCNCNSV